MMMMAIMMVMSMMSRSMGMSMITRTSWSLSMLRVKVHMLRKATVRIDSEMPRQAVNNVRTHADVALIRHF